MPYVNIRITREGGTTPEQKAALIRGVTDLLQQVLAKSPATTFVVIDEVDLDNWGAGGIPVREIRRREAAERAGGGAAARKPKASRTRRR